MWQRHILSVGFVVGAGFGIGSLLAGTAVTMKSTLHAELEDRAMMPGPMGETSEASMKGDPALVSALEQIREKFQLPALGGAIVDGAGLRAIGVVGVRARGESAAATPGDSWHVGSDSKAMTATMIAALVEQKRLSWDTTLSDVFPEMPLPAPAGGVTLLQLLSHRAGLPADTGWNALSRSGSLVEQRRAAVAGLASVELLSIPGSRFAYSNWGYVVAAAMAEQLTGKSYEALMQAIVFDPLLMKSPGFGAAGTPGKLDEPWGHSVAGTPSQSDNPLVLTPAGCVHCPLEDWGRFISDQLRGSGGKAALLGQESYVRLHSAPFGGSYALGWAVHDGSWGGGPVFSHSGSNTLNMAVVRMVPARDFAVLVVCNQGGSEKACDEVAGKLIAFHAGGEALP